MAGENTKPDAVGNASAIDVAAITKSVTEAVTKAVTDSFASRLGAIDELAKNQKVLADTIAQLPPGRADAKGEKNEDAPAALTAEAVAKLVAEGIAADRKAQAESSSKAQARKAAVDKLVKEKLGGDADFANLLTADSEEELGKQAEAIAAKVKTLRPDFGGAAKDGGENPNTNPAQNAKPIGNLPPGVARYAAAVKLPTAAKA